MKHIEPLDRIDRELVALLQVNARESIAELARTLGVARTTVISRIERLEEKNIIAGYTIKLGQDAFSSGLNAYVGIEIEPKSSKEVLKKLAYITEVRWVCAVSGHYDYIAWLKADTPEQLNTVLDKIGDFDGVIKTTTSVVLARVISVTDKE